MKIQLHNIKSLLFLGAFPIWICALFALKF
nr:MAG TPA: hypothetical protein [Caudoviricetes sp.]DAG51179.1 MAG TPA: hypothetical protein [Caudoviricetes sp.]